MATVTKLYATILSITLASTMTACGSIGLTQGGKQESKGAKAQPTTSSSQGSGKGVRFALGLPKSFEDDGKDQKEDVAVEESGMAAEFEESFESERIVVTCDGEPMKDFDKIKGKKMRGIFELTLIGKLAGGSEKEPKEPQEPPAPSDKKEELELKKGEAPDAINPDVLKEEKEEMEAPKPEPAPDAPDAPKPEWIENEAPSTMIVEHLAVPFVCPANAAVEIVDLAGGYEYYIEANLYTASGALRYSGATDTFTAGDTKAVDLVMSPVQSTGVSINVIFADGETKKASKK